MAKESLGSEAIPMETEQQNSVPQPVDAIPPIRVSMEDILNTNQPKSTALPAPAQYVTLHTKHIFL